MKHIEPVNNHYTQDDLHIALGIIHRMQYEARIAMGNPEAMTHAIAVLVASWKITGRKKIGKENFDQLWQECLINAEEFLKNGR